MYPSARSRGNNPACNSDDLPRPDWPKSTVRFFLATRRSNSSASSISAVEEPLKLFRERDQARPGILRINTGTQGTLR